MNALIHFGFTMEEIENMMDTNKEIDGTPDKNINEIITLLKSIGCEDLQIKNIFICNPFCLTRKISDLNSLIQRFYEIDCSYLNLVFDSNPYLLNLQLEEFNLWYNKRIYEGLSKEEIVDYLQYNMIF